jgi:hypothetical protein
VSGTTAVTVGAYHLAFLDLGEDDFPRPPDKMGTDRELLVAKVIELQNDGVCLAAVRARMRLEVVE